MITIISDSLFLFYFIAIGAIFVIFYKFIKNKKISKNSIAIILIGIAYVAFYSYESMPEENIQCNHIAVSSIEELSEKEIICKILNQEFEHYRSQKIFTRKKIFDYKINRITGPIKYQDKNGHRYYDVSYSVKTISPEWIAGNGECKGLWISNKSGFFILIRDNEHYVLKFIGGL